MPKITVNQFRKPLVNKRDEYIEYGSNGVEPEKLNPINGSTSSVPRYYAILNECIWEGDESNFIDVKYGEDINNLTRLDPSNYEVNSTTAIIKFAENYNANNVPHYAFYKAGGSIIWVEDVNSLQKACTDIDNYAIYKDGSTSMSADLDIGYNNIINVTRVDSIALRNHSHTNMSGDAPQITASGLATSAVETAKLADYAVTEIKLATDAVSTDKILDYSVTLSKMDDNSVDNSKLVNNTIESIKLKDNTLETNKIKTGTIEYTKLNTSASNPNNVLKGIFDVLYPVGSIYITTASTCPVANYVGTWETISAGRILQQVVSGQSAGDYRSAGLPNITGTHTIVGAKYLAADGCFQKQNASSNTWTDSHDREGKDRIVKLDASKSNSVYGSSTSTVDQPVQPNTLLVNIFKRTA